MRVPDFEQFAGYTRSVGIFIAGMIVGAAVLLAAVHANLNDLMTENQRLEMEMDMIHENTKSASKEQRVISEIEVFLNPAEKLELSPVTSTKLRSLISKDLTELKGKRVYHTAPRTNGGVQVLETLFMQLYQNIDGKDYMVDIDHFTIVYGVLTVWANIEEYKPSNV